VNRFRSAGEPVSVSRPGAKKKTKNQEYLIGRSNYLWKKASPFTKKNPIKNPERNIKIETKSQTLDHSSTQFKMDATSSRRAQTVREASHSANGQLRNKNKRTPQKGEKRRNGRDSPQKKRTEAEVACRGEIRSEETEPR